VSFFQRIREGLSRTTQQIVDRFDEISRRADEPERRARPVDVETVEALEELLISADIGVAATERIIAAISTKSRNGASLRDLVKQEIRAVFAAVDTPVVVATPPRVTLVVGVNGTGKTTTIGKLAQKLREHGRSVLVGAADTFRAAAEEQLEIWAERAGADFVGAPRGADPAAVAFDAVEAARARGHDVAIIDTAGRLHTQANLMAELEKVRRVIATRMEGAPHETLLVVDATTGQNGLQQARLFGDAVGVTGVALTKLDGSARGGVAIAIAVELGLPVKLVGVGEGVDDLRPFDAHDYARALIAG
jgi:fused signal recognition particle receptor